jgi:hypothetical protein
MPQQTLLAAVLLTLWAGAAQADPAIDALRAEIRQMREMYEARLSELETRLKQAESRPSPATVTTTANASNANPEIGLVLLGSYARREAGEHPLTGFLPAGHDHGGERGFALDHTELTLAANIDPTLRGYANIAYADEEVAVDEAWFQTLGLGHGFTLKGGRFLSGIGYANEQHPHAWDFVDNSLMYRALFGEHFSQDGVQLKWLAPTDTFLELGLELGRGGNFPGSGDGGNKNGPGAWAAFAHVGGDAGANASWRGGLSYLAARPRNRSSGVEDLNGTEVETLFSGKSRAWLADFVWKWAPDGNHRARNLKLQAEYFRRNESGTLTCLDPDAATPGDLCDGDPADAHRSRQSGWYAQTVYQFMPRWRLGLRYDRLDSGRVDFGLNNAVLPVTGFSPHKWSLMADYAASEFSLFRLQLARDRSTLGNPDDKQITLQYVHSLGAHGAHKY